MSVPRQVESDAIEIDSIDNSLFRYKIESSQSCFLKILFCYFTRPAFIDSRFVSADYLSFPALHVSFITKITCQKIILLSLI